VKDKRQHSNVLDAILTIIWWLQKLHGDSVSKQLMQKFDMERFNLQKLNDSAVKEE
jgi:hypothetical protein